MPKSKLCIVKAFSKSVALHTENRLNWLTLKTNKISTYAKHKTRSTEAIEGSLKELRGRMYYLKQSVTGLFEGLLKISILVWQEKSIWKV